jgi:hypothetical protein
VETEAIPEPEPVKSSNKKKGKKSAQPLQDEGDEIDSAMREIEAKFGPALSSSTTITPQSTVKTCITIDSRMLDGDMELRRKFGRVVEEETRGRSTKAKRAVLVAPKTTWPPYSSGGLSMIMVEKKGTDTYFSLTHSKTYQSAQLEFYQMVETVP